MEDEVVEPVSNVEEEEGDDSDGKDDGGVGENDIPVVEPVGNVEEEETAEDEAEAEHEQLHPRFVLKVVFSESGHLAFSDHVCVGVIEENDDGGYDW